MAKNHTFTTGKFQCISRCYAAAIFLLSALVFFSADRQAGAVNLPDLLIVKLPAYTKSPAPFPTYYIDGCSINRLSVNDTGVEIQNLTPDFLSARDPSVSFDGSKIFFVGKKDEKSYYQVYSMNADGSEIMQLTRELADHTSPLQVGSLFYLNDSKPTPQIIYGRKLHTSPQIIALFAANLDGSFSRQITHNIFSDFGPDVLPNGRLIFSSFSDKNLTGQPISQLMAINIDGTDLMPVTGEQSPEKNQRMAKTGFDDAIYFIETSGKDELSGGNIVTVSRFRSLHSYKNIAAHEIFTFPCPLPDGSLLASMKGHKGYYQLVHVGNKGRSELIYAESGIHILDAQPLVPKKQVRGRSSVVGFRHKDTGVFFCMDVYESDQKHIKALNPGEVKEVVIAEAVRSPVSLNTTTDAIPQDSQERSDNSPVHYRILGKVPVENDGSFHVRVPAETPLTFHLIDAQGKILASQRSVTWVMPGESRGCIGCHEDRELSPPNKFIDAVKKPPPELLTPPAERQLSLLKGAK